MKDENSKKYAWLNSIVLMILCFAMLMGTTFAWFTDTVSTGKNVVKSGTLDVDLIHVRGNEEGEDISLSEETGHLVFDYDKWEPGYTQVETLKVINQGNLALRFTLRSSIPKDTSEDNSTGVSLAEVIDVYVYPGDREPESFEEVQTTWVNTGTLADLLEQDDEKDGMAWGVILPVDSDGKILPGYLEEGVSVENNQWLSAGSSTMSIALHMQESADNRYQGLDLGDMYLTLEATQWTYEEDSFDHLYDASASEDDWIYVYTGEQLKSALELDSDAKIKVMRDLNVSGSAAVTGTMFLDLNGYTVRDERENGGQGIWVQSDGNVTITGNGTWLKTNHAGNMFYVDGGFTIMNGRFAYTPYVFGENCGHSGGDSSHAKDIQNPQKLGSIICGRKGTQYNGVCKIYDGYFDSGIQNPEKVTEHSFADGVDLGNDDNMYPLLNSNESHLLELKIYGGTFMSADPAGGDANGPVLFLEGQTVRYEVPEGYTIRKESPTSGADLRTYYTVSYRAQ